MEVKSRSGSELKKAVKDEQKQEQLTPTSASTSSSDGMSFPPRSTIHGKKGEHELPASRSNRFIGIGAFVVSVIVIGAVILSKQSIDVVSPSGQAQVILGIESGEQQAGRDTIVQPVSSDSPVQKPATNEHVQHVNTEAANQPKTEPENTAQTETVIAQQPPAEPPVEEKIASEQQAVAVSPPAVERRILKHKVQPGETLYRISLHYYNTGRYATYLAQYNKVYRTDNLIIGTIIHIPIPPR